MVRSPYTNCLSARCITSRISLMPLVTAEKLMKEALVWLAITWARVVLPTPGGPQKIMEDTWSPSTMRRSTLPGPSKCFCPMISSSVSGRSLAAKG